MAYNHLSQAECDQYDIYLSNDIKEDNLEENEQSSASSWETTLHSSLDLSSLLYMKSVSALIGLTRLTIDNLPLTFCESEDIKVKIWMPNETVYCNQMYSIEQLAELNNTPLSLPLQDFCTNEPGETLMFLNEKLGVPVTEFIIQRFLTLAFDANVFLKEKRGCFSLKDFKLLTRYIDITLLHRQILHDFVCLQAGIHDDSVASVISYQSRENITKRNEQSMLEESETLCPVDERPKPHESVNIDFTLFYGLSLPDVYDSKDGPKLVIESAVHNWLENSTLLERTTPGDPSSPLTEENESQIKKMVEANKRLITLAIKTRQVINFLKERIDKRKTKKESTLFHEQFLSLDLDNSNSRCAFLINPKLFLPNDQTSVSVIFPPQASYVLGAKDGQQITVGPIPYEMANKTSPKLSHQIVSPNQVPFSAIRPLPKLLYVATNLVTSLSRDMWLSNTKYSAFHLIYCHVINEGTVANKFICKDATDETYFKMPNLKNLLDRVTIHILDQNFRLVLFPQKTYTKLSLAIKPAPLDH